MPIKRTRSVRHVAVLIESSLGYGRGLLEGIARYSREQGNWVLYFELRGLEPFPLWMRDWKGDGILVSFPSWQVTPALLAKRVPVVDLNGSLTPYGLPQVDTDNTAVARLALEHFWERGIRHFGFCGLPRGDWPLMDQRGEAFAGQVKAAGCSCSLFAWPARHQAGTDWKQEVEEIAAWLTELPKPVGVLAYFDDRGYQVLNACRRAGLTVPEEVAVLGVSNDVLLCGMCLPPLSSIDLNAEQIGYVAAAYLDRRMRGGAPLRSPQIIPPRGVVPRRSTDVLATDDADLAAALRFIRDHACDGIRVDDVLREVAISQRALERKCRAFLGRTPKAELLRVQMTRASELLTDSDLPIKEVAQRCGFHNKEIYFSNAFYRQYGVWPTAYRRRSRHSGSLVDG
jgi:LacI family transcriptional regulator